MTHPATTTTRSHADKIVMTLSRHIPTAQTVRQDAKLTGLSLTKIKEMLRDLECEGLVHCGHCGGCDIFGLTDAGDARKRNLGRAQKGQHGDTA